MPEPVMNQNVGAFPRLHFRIDVPSSLMYFACVIFLVGLADAIFSYYIPVYIEQNVSGPLILGLILSFNSVVGIVADLIIGEWSRYRRFSFFLRWTFAIALSYPIALLVLPAHPLFLTAAVGVWGIFYEMLSFAEYQFIHVYTSRNQHAQAWGLISTFNAVAYTLGPVLSSNLIDRDPKLPFIACILIVLVSGTAMALFLRTHRSHKHPVYNVSAPRPKSILHELRVWKLLYSRMWHLLIFVASLAIVDNNFWTIGTVLSEQLPKQYDHGLLIVLYTIPSLFMGLIAGRIASIRGKKRAAFVCGLFAGAILVYSGLTPSIPSLMLSVFCASLFLSIAWPEVNAVLEDFVSRLGANSNELIAMQNSHLNLAYIIGPIFSGIIATLVGNQASFSVVGALLCVVSIFALLSVPRKIKLPQAQLEVIL